MKDLASIPLPELRSAPRHVKEPEVLWHRADDGVQLGCRVWRGNSGSPVVLYLHGIEGHSQWFENSASALNEKGVTVYAPDRRGAGMNPRDRGHLGSYKTYLGDIYKLLGLISVDHPGHAVVVWGHCWGAKAAALVCREVDEKTRLKEDGVAHGHPVSGLVLSCPAIYTRVDFDMKTKLTIAFNHFMGDRRALRKFDIPIKSTMFTDNPTYLGYIEKDPMRIREATSTFFFESFMLSQLSQKAASKISLPTLILQGGSDQIVDIPKVEAWLSRTGSTDKSMRIFPEAHHSIEFDETWFKEYIHLVSGWIQARSPVIV